MTKKEEKINISFVDKDNNKTIANIEFKEKENKTLCFSMCGEYGRSSGQCFDSVKPRTAAQGRLIQIWTDHHLNDMNAGTPKQEEALKDFDGDYTAQCEHLKQKGLYEVTLKDGTKYKYGTSWLYRELPKDLKKEVLQLKATIEKEELAFKGEKIKESTIKSFDDFDDYKIIALAQHLEITPQEAEDIQESYNNVYTFQGTDYFIGDEDETHKRAMEYLTDDTYIYESWVKKQLEDGCGDQIKNLTDWAEWVIEMDGYGHILNSWDGSEDTETVEGTEYYIIRQ